MCEQTNNTTTSRLNLGLSRTEHTRQVHLHTLLTARIRTTMLTISAAKLALGANLWQAHSPQCSFPCRTVCRKSLPEEAVGPSSTATMPRWQPALLDGCSGMGEALRNNSIIQSLLDPHQICQQPEPLRAQHHKQPSSHPMYGTAHRSRCRGCQRCPGPAAQPRCRGGSGTS